MQTKPLWLTRILIIVVTMAVSLLARTIAVSALGIDFVSTGGNLGHDQIDVGVRPALVVPLAASLLGWLAWEVLSRLRMPYARTIWLVGAVALLVASIVVLFPWPMASDVRLTLVILHLLVGAAFIPAFYATTGPGSSHHPE